MGGPAFPEIQNLRVPRTEVGMDYDANVDGHMPNASCLPKTMSNDRAFIETRRVGSENALCIQPNSEVGGVLDKRYLNCLTESGNLVALDSQNQQQQLSGARTPAGRERLAAVLAQTYDCYVLQERPPELVRQLWNRKSSPESFAPAFRQAHALLAKRGSATLPADIDQDPERKFPPTVGIVTVAAGMTDDTVTLLPVALKGKPAICAKFTSEVAEPYGNGKVAQGAARQAICLMEDGALRVDFSAVPFDEARMRQNLGNAVAMAFSGPSDVSRRIVAGAKSLRAPAEQVKRGEAVEERSWWKVVNEGMLRSFDGLPY